jgi:arylsulfatase A-like enzyme
LIVKYPGSDLGGTDDNRLVNNVDLAPTLLSAAGVDVPPTMRGLNLLDLDAQREHVFAESGGEYMVRSRTHKLLLHRSRAPMFFDLARDPSELENIYARAGSQAEIARLRERLLDWALFDSQAPNHRDLDAPLCRADNALPQRGGSRPYYQARMAEPWELPG